MTGVGNSWGQGCVYGEPLYQFLCLVSVSVIQMSRGGCREQIWQIVCCPTVWLWILFPRDTVDTYSLWLFLLHCAKACTFCHRPRLLSDEYSGARWYLIPVPYLITNREPKSSDGSNGRGQSRLWCAQWPAGESAHCHAAHTVQWWEKRRLSTGSEAAGYPTGGVVKAVLLRDQLGKEA